MKHLIIICFFFCCGVNNLLYSACTPNLPPSLLRGILVDSVSVNFNTQKATIGWRNTSNQSIWWFYIRKKDPLTALDITIDSVRNDKPLIYTYNLSNARNTSEQYAIGFRDSCNNVMQTVLDYHSTIFLKSTVDICKSTINLEWTGYDTFTPTPPEGVKYIIYLKKGTAPFNPIGNTDMKKFSYKIKDTRVSHLFFIRAVQNDGNKNFTSSSNIDTINTVFYKSPLLIDMTKVSFEKSTLELENGLGQKPTIKVIVKLSGTDDINEYILKRKRSDQENFLKIATFDNLAKKYDAIVFEDNDVSPTTYQYTYKLEAINPCKEISSVSNSVRSIFLESFLKETYTLNNTLSFNNINKLSKDTIEYIIFKRYLEDNVASELNSSILTKNNVERNIIYKDIISSKKSTSGRYCYQILAQDKKKELMNYSNVSCINYSANSYIPNTFIVNSVITDQFKPIFSSKNIKEYKFSIYDSNGGVLFSTTNVNKGWDGMSKGIQLATPRKYSYVYKYLDGSNLQEQVIIGTVLLIAK